MNYKTVKQKLIDKVNYLLVPQDWNYKTRIDVVDTKFIDQNRPIEIVAQLDHTDFINIGIENGDRIVQIIDQMGSFNYDQTQEGVRLLGPYKYTNGDLYFGQYRAGIREGKGEMWDINHNLYQGYFKNDKFNGKGRMIDIHSIVYEGEWLNGCINGLGSIMNLNGQTYTGQWFDNMKNQMGEENYADGSIFKGVHVFGFKQGHCEITFGNKSKFVGQMVQNQLDNGVYTFKYGSYEGSFRNDRFHGKAILTINDYRLLLEDVKKIKDALLKKNDIKTYQKVKRKIGLMSLFKKNVVKLSKQEIAKQKQEEKERKQNEKKQKKQEEKERKQKEKERKQKEKQALKLQKLQQKKGLKSEVYQTTYQKELIKSIFGIKQPKTVVIEGVFDDGKLIEYENKEIMKVVNDGNIGNLQPRMEKIIQDQLIYQINDDDFKYGDIHINDEFEEFNDIQCVDQLGDLRNRLLVKCNRLNEMDEKNMKIKMIFKQKEEGSIWMRDNDSTRIPMMRVVKTDNAQQITEHDIEVDVRNELLDMIKYQQQDSIGLLDLYWKQQSEDNKQHSYNKSMTINKISGV